ncbi:cytochrome P450 [Pelagibius sp. 7325]|uniref:cytochrome P450 n=1 Tax=Pelagibius sp. 7325 TaxID=3131994 RepID=UPI0030ED440D
MPQVADANGAAQPAVVTVHELEADPHGVFRHHRAIAPVIQRDDGSFLVLRARESEELLKDKRFCQPGAAFAKLRGINNGMLLALFDQTMLTSNGTMHRRRRSPFTRAFALRMIVALRPSIRQAAHNLLDDWAGEEVDFVDRYAALLPAHLISEMLGLAKEDIPHFTQCVYEVSRALSFTFGPEDLPAIERAAQDLYSYVTHVLETKRRRPSGDFLSNFLTDVKAAGDLSPLDSVIQVMTVIIGGTDTTRVAMAMLVGMLLEHPEQWEAVLQDRRLVQGAVKEALRFEPSVGSVSRMTTEDVAVGDYLLPAGRYVTFSVMSAMRDEAVYEKPDRFDIRRRDHPRLHPVFGAGSHRCLGEALALAELEEGLTALLERFPRLRLIEGLPRVSGHAGIRRIGPMPVRWA